MPTHCLILIAAVVLMVAIGGWGCSLASAETSPSSAALEVRIAVPIHQSSRSIVAGQGAGIFNVVLTNRSSQPLKLWTPLCSFGYDALRFQATDSSGRTWNIHRKPQAFRQNLPDSLTLMPGDMFVLPVALSPQTWELDGALPPPGQFATLQLRAVYAINPDPLASQAGIWVGQVHSPIDQYRVAHAVAPADKP